MIQFKACTRCRGDLYTESDRYGAYVACLQCGNVMADLDEEESSDSVEEVMEMASSVSPHVA